MGDLDELEYTELDDDVHFFSVPVSGKFGPEN